MHKNYPSPSQRSAACQPGPSDGGAKVAEGWFSRGISAVNRRTRRALRRFERIEAGRSVQLAVDWLGDRQRDGGFAPGSVERDCCPGLTAALMPTLLDLGQHETAMNSAAWLVRAQQPDGSFADATEQGQSLFHTALGLRAFLAMQELNPDLETMARRAAIFLANSIAGDGRMKIPTHGNSVDRWAAETFLLAVLPPLRAAAVRFDEPRWREAATKAARRLLREWSVDHRSSVDFLFTTELEALVDLGFHEEVQAALRAMEAVQRRDGTLPTALGVGRLSVRATGQLATVWLKLGNHEPAQRALAYLRRQQQGDGSLSEYGGRRMTRRRRAAVWGLHHFLEASRLEVQAAFEADFAQLPETIEAEDGRVTALYQWAAHLDHHARIADVGCGSGRMLKHLQQWLPEAMLTGVDGAVRMLDRLPSNVEARQGNLLNLPLADESFDGVLCIEALEHALLPHRAVDELCRIVRPGGQVLIIDKHRRRQPLSLHAPWERWFEPDEVCRWLSRHCRDVTVRPVSHGTRRPSDGLFLCWQGVRRTDRVAFPTPDHRPVQEKEAA